MPELAEVETQKTAGFVDRGYNHAKRKQRMEEEAKEIAELEAQQRGEPNEEQEVVEEETPDTEVEETTLSAEERSFKKRYGDLRRHMQEKEKEWNDKFDVFEKRMEKESIVPPKSDEDIDAWAAQVELFGPGTAIPRARRVSNAARVAHSMTRTTREVISTLRIRSVSFT